MTQLIKDFVFSMTGVERFDKYKITADEVTIWITYPDGTKAEQTHSVWDILAWVYSETKN